MIMIFFGENFSPFGKRVPANLSLLYSTPLLGDIIIKLNLFADMGVESKNMKYPV